jgi:beta-N-acetylhexosaminidase
VRNADGLLPLHLDAEERVLALALLPETLTLAIDSLYAHDVLVDGIRAHHENTYGFTLPSLANEGELAAMWESVEAADVVVVATLNANLDERQAERVRALVRLGKRVVGIAVAAPYDVLAFPELQTYLVTYEYTQPALSTAAQALFGVVDVTGRLPVSLPGL